MEHLEHLPLEDPPSTSTPRSRTKRTHARRSCNTCKLRKTRCELPDQMIPSSPAGLPRDKACHRCRTLNLTCIVDDKGRKRGLPRDADGQLIAPKETWEDDSFAQSYEGRGELSEVFEESYAGPSGRARNGRGRMAKQEEAQSPQITTGNAYPEEHGDLLHGIVPYPAKNADDLLAEFQFTPPRAEAMTSEQQRNMKLHGRPLELVSAMLGSVYGRKIKKLDLGRLVDDDLRKRLEPGVLSLKTYHPWLPTLDEQFQRYDPKTCTDPATLLLATVLYLASTSIPLHTGQLRATLSPLIASLRDSLLLHVASSLAAVQALEMLAVHAPLGNLPWDRVDFRNLGVGRGQVSTALAIEHSLGQQTFAFRADVDPFVHWEFRGFWLWLCLVADQARFALEDEWHDCKSPAELGDAKILAEGILSNGSLLQWGGAGSEADCAELVGRLSVCHRVSRLALVHETLDRIRNALEGLANDAFYNLIGEVVRLMDEFEARQRALEAQYDRIAGIISTSTSCSSLLTSGAQVYRQVGWRFEFSRVFMIGVRTLICSGYLPGTPLSLDGLPTDLPYNERLSYALDESIAPANVMRIATRSSHPATQQIRDRFTKRGEICDGLLSAFAELNDVLVPETNRSGRRASSEDVPVPVVPIVELASIAVESNKILMEMRAGQIVSARLYPNFISPSTYKLPSWYFIMKQVSEIMLRIANRFDPKNVDQTELQTVLMGCGNLIASMVRVTDDWKRQQREEIASAAGTPVNGVGRGASMENVPTPQPTTLSNPSSITPTITTPDVGPRPYGDYSNRPSGVFDPAQGSGGMLPQFNYLAQHSDASSGYMPFSETQQNTSGQGFNYPAVDYSTSVGTSVDPAQQLSYNDQTGGYAPLAQQSGQQNDYAPTALDFLVAQMFNYSYLPPGQSQGRGV